MAAEEDAGQLRKDIEELNAALCDVEHRLRLAQSHLSALQSSSPHLFQSNPDQEGVGAAGQVDAPHEAESAQHPALLQQIESVVDETSQLETTEANLDPQVEILCASCEELFRMLQEQQVGPGLQEYAFLGKVREVLQQSNEQEYPQRLLEVLNFCDRMAAPYVGTAFSVLQQQGQKIRRLIQQCLPDYTLIQADGVDLEAPGPRLPIAQSMVLTTGVRDATGHEVSRPFAVHPWPGEVSPVIRAAWGLCEDLYLWLWRDWRKTLREDCDRCRDLVSTMQKCSHNDQVQHLRNILNIHTRYGLAEDTLALETALSLLNKEGLRALRIDVGLRFDPEKYDHKRYDRIMREHPIAESGSVIGIRQIGFSGSDGLPLQKCIAVVAQ